jgi:hypothetical protein
MERYNILDVSDIKAAGKHLESWVKAQKTRKGTN